MRQVAAAAGTRAGAQAAPADCRPGGLAGCSGLALPAAILRGRQQRTTGERTMLEEIKKDAQTRMSKSVESLRHDLTHLRTGRASVALVDQLQVPYYGADVPLPQVANIAVADARSLTITPFEKTMVAVVEKAILGSNLGLTPTTVGQVIRINLPALTEQRRKELSKQVAGEGENAKVAIRNIRRDAIHHVKELLKDKKISEDEEHRGEDDIQKLTDRFVKEVDGVVKNKEDELMAI
jgi:ribosome recycling factor